MSTPRTVRMREVESESITWIWPGHIPAGKLTTLDGDPGLGKSMLSLDLASRLSRGQPLPDGSGGGRIIRTLILQAEDGVANTVQPRLVAAGADLDHVFVFEHEDGRPIRLPRDLPALDRMIEADSIGLVVIDPFVAFLSRRILVTSDQAVRRLLRRLADIAARTGAAILLIRHLNKRTGEKALYRGGGSIGIVGSARAGLLVANDPTTPGRCVLTQTKANLDECPPALAYRIVNSATGTGRIDWQGLVDLTADEALHPAKTAAAKELGEVEATDWLMIFLKDGPRPAMEVLTAARAAGISERTLTRAKKTAGVKSKVELNRATKDRWWEWGLPG